MGDYIISCCSTADLTKEHFLKRNISYICFHYELDGVSYQDDLGETMSSEAFYEAMTKGADTKTSQKTTPPVILPEAQTQTSEGTAEKTQTQEETPAPKGPFQNSMIWIILLAGAGIVAFYYFKIYKPEHEEEEDDSEGIATVDGLPTEFDE
jgi:hypothetical protein